MKQKKLFIILGPWTLVSLVFPVVHDGLNSSSVTRLLILAYFLLCLLWFYKRGQFIEVKNSKGTFIVWCLVNAMVVEIFHMISMPLHQSLLITLNTPLFQALENISIDLVLTLPVYLIIFWIIWNLIKRYNYSSFSFFILIGLGQALGDGNSFFIANPGALIFLPYVMLNYWAMNFVPYLVVRKQISDTLQDNKWLKIVLPIVLLPTVYFVAGGAILAIGKILGWFPK